MKTFILEFLVPGGLTLLAAYVCYFQYTLLEEKRKRRQDRKINYEREQQSLKSANE